MPWLGDSWNQYMEIHDQELVIVKADSVMQDYDGNVKERLANGWTRPFWYWCGSYPYYMLKEIDEQPTVMQVDP